MYMYIYMGKNMFQTINQLLFISSEVVGINTASAVSRGYPNWPDIGAAPTWDPNRRWLHPSSILSPLYAHVAWICS